MFIGRIWLSYVYVGLSHSLSRDRLCACVRAEHIYRTKNLAMFPPDDVLRLYRSVPWLSVSTLFV